MSPSAEHDAFLERLIAGEASTEAGRNETTRMNTLPNGLREALSRPVGHLRLYNMEYCSYCRKVQREAHKLGINLVVLDVFTDRVARERLRVATGRTRVPVLGILDENGLEDFLPESDEIISYLRQHATENEAPTSA